MSIGLFEYNRKEIAAGSNVSVNSRTVNGTAIILSEGLIREISIVTLGADKNTNAAFFQQQGNKPLEQKMSELTIEEMKAELEKVNKEVAEMESAKLAAEKALADERNANRLKEVKALFSEFGTTITDEQALPYIELSADSFAAVAKDMRSLKPKVSSALFQEQAKSADNGTEHKESILNASSIYAKRQAAMLS
jgi:hypothetical protein